MSQIRFEWIQSADRVRVPLGDSSSGEDCLVIDNPITFNEIRKGDRRLEFKSPLIFNWIFDNTTGNLFVEDSELGIFESERSLPELKKSLSDELFLIWDEYGKEKDDNLCESAKLLKKKLRGLIFEPMVFVQCQNQNEMSNMALRTRVLENPTMITMLLFTT